MKAILPNLAEHEVHRLLADQQHLVASDSTVGMAVAHAADAYFAEQAPQAPNSASSPLGLPGSGSTATAGASNGSGSGGDGDGQGGDGGGIGSEAADAKAAKKPVLPRYFGVSVVDLMSLPGTRERSLPRIIVYLCEYLLTRASRKADRHPASVIDDLWGMIQDAVSTVQSPSLHLSSK